MNLKIFNKIIIIKKIKNLRRRNITTSITSSPTIININNNTLCNYSKIISTRSQVRQFIHRKSLDEVFKYAIIKKFISQRLENPQSFFPDFLREGVIEKFYNVLVDLQLKQISESFSVQTHVVQDQQNQP